MALKDLNAKWTRMAAEDAEHTEHLGRLVAEWQLRADMALDGGGGTTAMVQVPLEGSG